MRPVVVAPRVGRAARVVDQIGNGQQEHAARAEDKVARADERGEPRKGRQVGRLVRAELLDQGRVHRRLEAPVVNGFRDAALPADEALQNGRLERGDEALLEDLGREELSRARERGEEGDVRRVEAGLAVHAQD